jgi:hypothetical protein
LSYHAGQFLFGDKILLTQTDGNEYIDSLADGYVDIGATTAIRLNGDVTIAAAKTMTLGAAAIIDAYTNGGYIKPRRTTALGLPTPAVGEIMVARDEGDNSIWLLYNDVNEGVKKVELT